MHIFVWLGIVFLIVFNIVPMLGLVIAFKDYKISAGFMGMFQGEFVGLKYFREFITDRKFLPLLRNTLSISGLKLVFLFPVPIIFAIMLSEMRGRVYKRVVQTISYLPHFISWVIVSGIFFVFFSANTGVLNEVLIKWGIIDEPLRILMAPEYYYGLAVGSELWKETGWSAIIYLAAIAGIDPSLYESAQIDGAGRLQRIWHITIPCIMGTMSILLILSIGGILGAAGFEQSMLLGNSMNVSRSEILEVYTYQMGLGKMRYSFAAAAGMFQSVISLILVLAANTASRRLSGSSLF
jgi:putative aldouronate transport system permease protein